MNVGVGDVVLVDNLKQHFVVVSIKNNEDLGSMCEDKVYFIASIDLLNYEDSVYDLVNAVPVKIQGPNPQHSITLVEHEAPFIIKKIEAVRVVRRKVAKQITVYE